MHYLASGLLDLKFEELVAEVDLTSGQLTLVKVALVTRCTGPVRLDPLAPFLNRVKA